MTISYDLKDTNSNTIVSHEELINLVQDKTLDLELDLFEARKLDFNINYMKKDLIHIARYYDIHIRRKTKSKLIEEIIKFENNEENKEKVERREILWFYMNELQNDCYLKQFIIFE